MLSTQSFDRLNKKAGSNFFSQTCTKLTLSDFFRPLHIFVRFPLAIELATFSLLVVFFIFVIERERWMAMRSTYLMSWISLNLLTVVSICRESFVGPNWPISSFRSSLCDSLWPKYWMSTGSYSLESSSRNCLFCKSRYGLYFPTWKSFFRSWHLLSYGMVQT